jgi:hypothetical protein
MHAVPEFCSDPAPQAHPMLVFGLFYFLIGVTLALNYRFGPLFGIIFPLIGLGAGFFVIGVSNWTTLLGTLFAIDAIVVLCCFAMFLRRTR